MNPRRGLWDAIFPLTKKLNRGSEHFRRLSKQLRTPIRAIFQLAMELPPGGETFVGCRKSHLPHLTAFYYDELTIKGNFDPFL